MEDIGADLFAEMIAEGAAEAVHEAVVVKEKVQGEDRERVNAARHIAFMKLPHTLIFDIIKTFTIVEEGKKVPNPKYADGTLGDKFSAVAMDDDCKSLPVKWTAKRLMAGWNKGACCSNIAQLNKLTAFNAQLEVVPIAYKKDTCTHVVVKKCRYDAIPYLPGKNFTRIARLLYREKDGLVVRPVPANLILAYNEKKVPWTVSAIATKLLPRVTAAFPEKIPNGASAVAAMGDNTLNLIKGELAKQSVAPVFDIQNMVDPARPDLSIFAGKVNADWSAFFDGFSYDDFDPVPVSRGVADINARAYVGELNDVAIWAQRPTVLKTPHKMESVLKHEHIPFRDVNRWPQAGLVYNPEFVDLQMMMAKMEVTHVVYPLHAMISNIRPVKYFCKRHEFVDIYVLCTSPAVAVITPAHKGLIGGSIAKHLPRIERAFVLGFIKILIEAGKSDRFYKGFRITPAEGYSQTKCYVNTQLIEGRFPMVCHRYVSMKKEEKERYTATNMLADVVIDGVRAYKKPEADAGVMAMYPRATPTAAAWCQRPLALGMAFAKESKLYDDPVTVALKDADLTRFYVAGDIKVDDAPEDERVQGRYGDVDDPMI